MNFLDFSTSNTIEENIIINVPDSNPVELPISIFYNKAAKPILISTAPSGGGTVLVNPLDGSSDYTPGGTVADAIFYPDSITPDVGYTTIAVTNATYHNTDLYVSFYPIADKISGSRINPVASYHTYFSIDISAADVDINLPYRPSINDRVFVQCTGGTGTYQGVLVPSGTQAVKVGSVTLDATARARFFEGNGNSELVYVATDEWQLVSYNDSGTLSGKRFDKYVNGKMEQFEYKSTLTATTLFANLFGSTSGNSYYTDNAITYALTFLTIIYAIPASDCKSVEANAVTTTGFNFRCMNESSRTSIKGGFIAVGTWY